MRAYATEQRQRLLRFLKEQPDRQLSVEEMAEALQDEGISLSSVYRNIKQMVESGDVVRRAMDGSRKFGYQYVGDAACQSHLHLKCEHCGKLIHADESVSKALADTAVRSGNFHINRKKTVLYGACDSCVKE